MSCWKKKRAASSDSRLERLTNSNSSPPDAYSMTMKMCVVVRNTCARCRRRRKSQVEAGSELGAWGRPTECAATVTAPLSGGLATDKQGRQSYLSDSNALVSNS